MLKLIGNEHITDKSFKNAIKYRLEIIKEIIVSNKIQYGFQTPQDFSFGEFFYEVEHVFKKDRNFFKTGLAAFSL